MSFVTCIFSRQSNQQAWTEDWPTPEKTQAKYNRELFIASAAPVRETCRPQLVLFYILFMPHLLAFLAFVVQDVPLFTANDGELRVNSADKRVSQRLSSGSLSYDAK